MSALEIDDQDIADGRVEGEEEELDDDVFKDIELPTFDDEQLQRIRDLQDDETLRECKDLLKENARLPTKLEALAKNINIRSFLRH